MSVIPDLVDVGGVWKVLPSGLHVTSLDEIERVFGTTEHRRPLFEGFARGCAVLERAGCGLVYLDGSFVTDKPEPRDFDACWDPSGVDPAKLDPVLLDFADGRAAQKAKYHGEFFIATASASPGAFFLQFFQIDRFTGKPKGILQVPLRQPKPHN